MPCILKFPPVGLPAAPTGGNFRMHGMSTSGNQVRLYELALEDGRSASPFVWRIRYALAHKGIPFETVYLGFTEIPTVFGGKFKTVPILEPADTPLPASRDTTTSLDRA